VPLESDASSARPQGTAVGLDDVASGHREVDDEPEDDREEQDAGDDSAEPRPPSANLNAS
jgi:hypothetical protein